MMKYYIILVQVYLNSNASSGCFHSCLAQCGSLYENSSFLLNSDRFLEFYSSEGMGPLPPLDFAYFSKCLLTSFLL